MMRSESVMNNGKENNEKVVDLRAQVDSVKSIMAQNVERILERGERLDDIERRTEQLHANSSNFKLTARKVQRKFCLLNAKWTFISILVTLLVIGVIVVLILWWAGVFDGKHHKVSDYNPSPV